jgi:hypothetical protein
MAGVAPERRDVLVERRGTIAVVTINRPQVRNAIDRPTAVALSEALEAFDDDTLSIGVLTGAGGPSWPAAGAMGAPRTAETGDRAPTAAHEVGGWRAADGDSLGGVRLPTRGSDAGFALSQAEALLQEAAVGEQAVEILLL